MQRLIFNPKLGRFVPRQGSDIPVPVGSIPENNVPIPTGSIPTGPQGRGTPPTMAPPTTTVPRTTSPTTTVPRSTSPTTTVPRTTSPTTTVPPQPAVDPAVAEALEGFNLDPALMTLLGSIYGGGTSGTSSGPSQANRRQASQTVKRAGRQAKRDYTRMANEGFDTSTKESDAYYKQRGATAKQGIDDATTAFLNSLITPTAYQNMPLPNMQVQEQGLGESLGAYGATGDLARQQRTADQGNLDFASQLASRSAGQLNTAQTNYMDAIRNAGLGGQASANLGLTQLLEGLRGSSRADAEAVRRDLLTRGIEAMISGNQNAANAFL